MSKLTKSVSLMTIVFILAAVNSCTKDELISNDNNTAIKKQKWNPGGNASFILPDNMLPFQYAVYKDDMDNLLEYTRTVLKNRQGGNGEEKGYFILSLSPDVIFAYYGFITETSRYYDPNIFINNPGDPFIVINNDTDDNMMYGCSKIKTENKEKFDKWVKRKINNGYQVVEWAEGNVYHAEACKPKN